MNFWKRGLLAVASASILWSVSARWGHPEDAVAVGLLLYAILAQSKGRLALAGWLAGAAVCVQPLVLLALPVMLAVLPWRRMVPFLVRAALPSALLLGAMAIANWHDTYLSVTSQPDSPVINHPTAWTSLAPADGRAERRGGPVPAGHDPARLPVRARGAPPPGSAAGGRDGQAGTVATARGRRRCSPTCCGGSR